jgi:hypothetical protein
VHRRPPMRHLLLALLLGCSSAEGSASDNFTTEHDDEETPDVRAPRSDSGGGSAFDVSDPAVTEPTDAKCASSTETAKPVPLDVLVMLDRSGSMKEATSSGASKWDAVKNAFKGFMADPASNGLGMGLAYFGKTGFLSDGKSSCTVSDYEKAEVPIAALPGVASSVNTSLLLQKPFTDTPTGPALQGALQYARKYRAANPGHVVTVVLATDGMPTACSPQDIPSIAAFATTARAEGINTYVIGVLSAEDLTGGGDGNLNQIAKAGNGADAFVIDSSKADVTKSFLDALAKIRGTALACEYLLPSGAGADYGKVNVLVTNSGGTTTVPYVESASKCDPVKGGWYYDVPPSAGKPKKILTCDATCKSLSVATSGKVDIQVGCASVLPK